MKTLDTRDLYKRKCELESLRDAVTTAREELDQIATNKPDEDEGLAAFEAWEKEKEDAESNLESAEADFGDDEKEELDELETLESEISGFMHGETMVRENDFEDYARELADDIGAIPDESRWPCTCIDWEQAAKELAMDYSEVTYQGDSYYVRS